MKEIIPLLLALTLSAYGQTFKVRGNVSTSTESVRYASVTFIDDNDTSRKFTAITDTSGNFQLDMLTSVKPRENVPTKFELEQNYPNPFSSSTSILYKLNEQSNISLRIYNVLGQVVKGFKVGTQGAGVHGVVWDGTNSFGRKVTHGVYFYQLIGGQKSEVKKMLFGFTGTDGRQLYLSGESFKKNVQSSGSELKKADLPSSQIRSFTVHIQNRDGTRPLILRTQFSVALSQEDTTLNYSVPLGYLLCYCGYGQIKISDITGSNPQNISLQDSGYKSGDYDDYPVWSPDGRYIVFQRLRADTIYNPFVYVYDTQNKTYTNLTSDGGIASSNPQWTPSGKIYFSYESPVLSPTATYMMNPDGSGKKKILSDSAASIYFLLDGYTFLYLNGAKIYKTNIDNTVNEYMCDVIPGIQDFNPEGQEFLLSTSSGGESVISTYNINTQYDSVVLAEEKGYSFFQAKWSKDYSQIVLTEHDTSSNDEYLSVFQGGGKRRLVYISGAIVDSIWNQFSWYSPRFSPDDRYIAFNIEIFKLGDWVNFLQDLYVADVNTGDAKRVDGGFDASWDPQP